MSLTYRVVPLTDADEIQGDGQWSQFTASWTDTLAVLERELDHLGATDVCFGLDVIAGQLTKDGRLRARSKASSRAVRISFETPDGPMHVETAEFVAKQWHSWLGQSYMREDWQHNVRAIALGLEALRKVDRYGIGRGQQYAGYKALGAGSGATAMGGMTRSEAITVLDDLWGPARGDWVLDEDGPRVLRAARRAAHPDLNGGDQSAWDRVEQAAKVLGMSS